MSQALLRGARGASLVKKSNPPHAHPKHQTAKARQQRWEIRTQLYKASIGGETDEEKCKVEQSEEGVEGWGR